MNTEYSYRPIRVPTNYDRGTPLSAGTICTLCLKAKPYCGTEQWSTVITGIRPYVSASQR